MRVKGRARGAGVLLAAVVGIAITANLGAWQLRRAAQKIAQQQALEARAHLPAIDNRALAAAPLEAEQQRYRATRLHGRWIAERTVFLDNRQMDGRVGFVVVTPLRLEGRGAAVVVERGFVLRDANDRTRLPAIATPAVDVEVVGHIAPPPARLFDFAGAASGPIRQNLDLSAFAADAGLTLLPLAVQQAATAATAGDGLVRHWQRPAVDVDKHYGYAFQWFALAALMASLYVWFQLVRPRLRRRS
jgi:surfeit locus 1 family protein